jgi:hypothetical protein
VKTVNALEAYLHAKRTYRLAEVALLDEQIAGIKRPAARQQIDLTRFDPAWKIAGKGSNLSKQGITAIIAAYDQFMSQSKVADLFQISSTAAHNWHEKWKLQQLATSTPVAPGPALTPLNVVAHDLASDRD